MDKRCTPLTSILVCSEYRSSNDCSTEERQSRLLLIREKAGQIRELTDVLLEGSRREPQDFADIRLLAEQLAEEFEESLEDAFAVETDLSLCGPFAGCFDVQELRRIFDNLTSNVRKYADPAHAVCLCVKTGEGLTVRQENRKREQTADAESFGIGLGSVRRIAQQYSGSVTVEEDETAFAIAVRLFAD